MAAVILSKHHDMSMKALWEALNDTTLESPEVAMAIVNDSRCGIERRSEVREGAMKNKAGTFLLNAHAGGTTPLILAALAGRNDVMEALLSLNASVDAKEDTFGYTALHVSALVNNVSAIGMLIAKGSDAEAVDKYGSTPLYTAVRFGELEAMELLVAKGSNVEAVSNSGYTPLHMVHQTLSHELLLAKGSDVNAVERDGIAPLHLAARQLQYVAIEPWLVSLA